MIFLAQTDTTAGFLSKNSSEINHAKHRNTQQVCILSASTFAALKIRARVPKKFRNFVRRAKKTTFIYPNKISFRVIKNTPHSKFLSHFDALFSSSANLHGQKFEQKFAKIMANSIVDDNFFEAGSSKMYRLNAKKIKKIR